MMDLNLVKFDSLLQDLKQEKSLEKNLSIIIRAIELEFHFQSLGIFLDSPKEKTFRLKISRGISHTFSKNRFFSYGDPFLKSLQDLDIKHFYDSQLFKLEKNFSHLVIIPLHNNRQLLGFFFMDRASGHFGPEEITKLSIFSSIISLGVNLVDLRTLIEHVKIFDEITNLYAYPSFIERAAYVFSLMKRHQKNLIISVFKVTNFDDLLRMHGKGKINETAKEVGEILLNLLRSSDLAGKIFKDTIAILMPETDVEGAQKVIDRLDKSILELDIMHGEKLDWGIAQMNKTTKDVHQLLHNAEEAAFEAIRLYDKNVVIFDGDRG
jgi:diguanylate cyclase (GGDEF)-like protein